MIKKVMLLCPPILVERTDEYEESYGAMTPLGLGYIASVLEQQGFEVCILDAVVEDFTRVVYDHDIFFRLGLDWEGILERIRNFAPDIIGISCMFTKNYRLTYHLAQLIKENIDKDVPLVAGGVHATVMPHHVMENSPFDFVLKGEAEYSFLHLINEINGEKDFSRVDGLLYRHEGSIIENEKCSYISPLSILPHPALHLMNTDLYSSIDRPYGQPGFHSRQSPAFPVITSRSCKARCCFCETWRVMGPKVRLRTAEDVLDEIEVLVETYGCRELLILDDNILVDADRASRIFRGLAQRAWDLVWRPLNGIAVWSMTEELMYEMSASGCYRISMAVESGNKRVLREIIKKPLDLDTVPRYTELAKELGLETFVLFVIGFPGESKEDIQDTIRFAEQLDVDQVVFSIATPFPGTKLHEVCKEKGYVRDLDLERLRFGMSTIETPEFTCDYLRRVRRDEWVRINFTRKGLKPPN